MNTSTPGDESAHQGPTESEVFAASAPFDEAGFSSNDGAGSSSVDEAFVGVDGFAPGGPLPAFGTGPVASSDIRVSCIDVARALPYFLDGELTLTQSGGVANHLSSCPPCQSAQAFQMQLRTVVADKAIDLVPDHVRARIITALGLA